MSHIRDKEMNDEQFTGSPTLIPHNNSYNFPEW